MEALWECGVGSGEGVMEVWLSTEAGGPSAVPAPPPLARTLGTLPGVATPQPPL